MSVRVMPGIDVFALNDWLVINVNQSCTLWSPVFKPVMVTAIDLYEFINTGTAVTRRPNFWRTLLTW